MTSPLKSVECTTRLEGKFIKKIEDKLCGRFDENLSAQEIKEVKDVSLDTDTGFELKSLILAQIERWRHA